MHASASPDNPRIVIPIFAGVGNALMAEPMVRQLRRARPGARVTVIARIAAMGEPYRRMPEVDEVLVTGNGWRGIVKKLWWTRRRRPDVVAAAVAGDAEVVDDDARPLAGERERMFPADAATGTGDDDHPSLTKHGR